MTGLGSDLGSSGQLAPRGHAATPFERTADNCPTLDPNAARNAHGHDTRATGHPRPQPRTCLPPAACVSVVCAADDGSLFTFGLNDWGQLGHSREDKFVAVRV